MTSNMVLAFMVLQLIIVLNFDTVLCNGNSSEPNGSSDQSSSPAAVIVQVRDEAFCLDPNYLKDTLQPLLETKIGMLFADVHGRTKFEASGVAHMPDREHDMGGFLVVLDDSTDLALLGQFYGQTMLTTPFHSNHQFVKSVNDTHHQLESQFEGIVLNPSTGNYLVARETIELSDGGFYPGVWEIKYLSDDHDEERSFYEVVEECWVNYEMESENKGFEGLEVIPTRDGQGVLLLGLCEGNHCGDGNAGEEKGNGIIVVSTYTSRRSSSLAEAKASSGKQQQTVCVWEPVKEIQIPSKADFKDYSDLAFVPSTGSAGNSNGSSIRQLSIVSQQESALFLADFDTETLEFIDDGHVYNFPRNDRCEVKHCNVEGIVWLDSVRFVTVSDKAKDDDPYFCLAGDQSIAVFSLPG